MKKALFIIIAIIAACFLLGNADTISEIFATARQGATIPLLLSLVIMLARHVTQAVSYQAAFEAVDFHGPKLWDYVVLIFSLVFINTFCLFSGATGVAFIIDDAHRKGADIGKATSGAVLSQIGYFAAVLVISIIGFATMMISGNVNWVFATGAALLACVLLGLSSMYLAGYYRPAWLYAFFGKVAVPLGKGARLVKHPLKSTWSNDTAESFINAARVMAGNPAGTATSLAWASFSAILNMLSLVAIGYAFGFGVVAALVAAFALAAISVILSPTPQGIGVVEAAIAAVLTAYGCPLPTATAIALVYRGIMFWVPFCIGAVLLSQSGFFQGKKDATQEQKDKDIAWITGTLVGVIGIVNIGATIVPAFFRPYSQLVDWIDFHAAFVGPNILLFGLLLIVMAIGLVRRYRLAWAITTTILVLAAGVEFLFYQTVPVAIVAVLLAGWLLLKSSVFDQPLIPTDTKVGQMVLEALQGKEATKAAMEALREAEVAAVPEPESSAQVAARIMGEGRVRLSAAEIAALLEDIESGTMSEEDFLASLQRVKDDSERIALAASEAAKAFDDSSSDELEEEGGQGVDEDASAGQQEGQDAGDVLVDDEVLGEGASEEAALQSDNDAADLAMSDEGKQATGDAGSSEQVQAESNDEQDSASGDAPADKAALDDGQATEGVREAAPVVG